MMKQTIVPPPPRNASTATQTRHKENKKNSGSWYYLQLQAAKLIQEQETRNLHSSSGIIEKETIRIMIRITTTTRLQRIDWLFDRSTKHQNSKHRYLNTADDRSRIEKKRRRSRGGCVPGSVDEIADCGLPCTKHRRGVGDRRGLVGSEEHENHESHNSGPNQRPTDAQHHGHGTTTKTNKKAMQLQTTSSSCSVKQYPPMYKEVLSWLCALQGRRLLAHRRHFVMGQSLVSTIETFPAQLVKDSLELHCALSPYVFNLICGIP